jgi:ABC-2 type transport system permease protein
MNPQRVSAGGAARRTQGLLFFLYPIALLPVLLAYLARYAFKSQLAFWAILALAAGLGAAIYAMALDSAVHAAHRRRETILAELSRGEGPVVAE